MDRKLGVYICSGCSIGESIDVNALANVAQDECKAPVCRIHPFLCCEDGLSAIRNDIEHGEVNALVIAGCSPRSKTDAFRFDSQVVMDRVNLREHVAWSHETNNEDTKMLAEDYLRMGIVKSQKMEPLEPFSDGISKTILVVGGGGRGRRRLPLPRRALLYRDDPPDDGHAAAEIPAPIPRPAYRRARAPSPRPRPPPRRAALRRARAGRGSRHRCRAA